MAVLCAMNKLTGGTTKSEAEVTTATYVSRTTKKFMQICHLLLPPSALSPLPYSVPPSSKLINETEPIYQRGVCVRLKFVASPLPLTSPGALRIGMGLIETDGGKGGNKNWRKGR